MTGCIAGCQYMPSIEFFCHWMHHHTIVLEAHEHFQKRTWRNKTGILTPSEPLFLSVPLKGGKHNGMNIRLIEIAYDEDWYRIHYNSIKTAYGKTSFFEEIEADLKAILFDQPRYLWDLNMQLLTFFTTLLKGKWEIKFSKSFIPAYPDEVIDLRHGVPAGMPDVNLLEAPHYEQVQRINKTHMPNLSILDVICHLGPETNEYLLRYAQKLYPSS